VSERDHAQDELLRLSWVPLFRARLSCDPTFLAEYATQLRSEGPGVALSNRGGWQSDDLRGAFRADPQRHEVLEEIEGLARRFVELYKTVDRPSGAEANPFELEICNLWANLNAPGDWNAAHHHPGAHISGVFYAQAPEGCGDLMLRPPYSFFDVVLDHTEQPSVTPEPGLVVLFPSDVFHHTEPNRGDADRISYSFNARYRPVAGDGKTFL